MKDTIKSARFWITVLILLSVVALAWVGKIGGDLAMSGLIGVAGGWGLSVGGAK